MKKLWLPYPLYFLKPFVVGFVGLILWYISEDLFISGIAVLCLGYAAWIISMRLIWSIVFAAKTLGGSAQSKKKETHFAKFPD